MKEGGSRLPRLAGDYITCLAHSPTDENVLAFATRKRDVYLTRDAGAHAGDSHSTTQEDR